jgi:hypothetical protein
MSKWLAQREMRAMQLSIALRLVRTIEPEAMRHRDHICSEAVAHDLANCPKMLSQIYAWRVESNLPAKPIGRVQPERIRSRRGTATSGRGKYLYPTSSVS